MVGVGVGVGVGVRVGVGVGVALALALALALPLPLPLALQVALRHPEHWRRLAGTGLAWLLYDYVYYGTAFNQPHIIEQG